MHKVVNKLLERIYSIFQTTYTTPYIQRFSYRTQLTVKQEIFNRIPRLLLLTKIKSAYETTCSIVEHLNRSGETVDCKCNFRNILPLLRIGFLNRNSSNVLYVSVQTSFETPKNTESCLLHR